MGLALTVTAHAQTARLWAGAGEADSPPSAAWKNARPNAKVRLPLPRGDEVEGLVQRVAQSSGDTEISGTLSTDPNGTFSATSSPAKGLHGLVLLPQRRVACRLSGTPDHPIVSEVPISSAICFEMPRPPAEASIVRGTSSSAAATTVPILNSRPSATAALYIDFDGAVVNDRDWNGGRTINASPSGLSAAEIAETWQRVSEDYRPFNVNVTTDVSRYNAAAVGRRMRCIVTPTDQWYAGGSAGGVSVIGSFAGAGRENSSTVPCWVFVISSAKNCAEAVAHEFGHTLGLSHDGSFAPSEEYYPGHGTGAFSWAPIMGVSYDRRITQWSKGEYPFANNNEDDLQIISSTLNGFGYAPSDAGNSTSTAASIAASGAHFDATGFIGKTGELDYYKIDVRNSGPFSVNAWSPNVGGNLAARVTLLRGNGGLVGSSEQTSLPEGDFTTTITPGTYYIIVTGIGHPASGSDYGFSNYDSLGTYALYAGPPIIKYQPDIALGKRPSQNGSEASLRRMVVTVRRLKPISLPVFFINKGIKPDHFRISVTNSSQHTFSVRLKGGRDITNALRLDAYVSPRLESSESLRLWLKIQPSRGARAKSHIKIQATSTSDKSRTDTAIIVLQRGKTATARAADGIAFP